MDMRFPPGYARTLAMIHARATADTETLSRLRATPAPPTVGDCDMTIRDFVRYADQRAMAKRLAAELLLHSPRKGNAAA